MTSGIQAEKGVPHQDLHNRYLIVTLSVFHKAASHEGVWRSEGKEPYILTAVTTWMPWPPGHVVLCNKYARLCVTVV